MTNPGGNAVAGLAATTWPGLTIIHPCSPLHALRAALPNVQIDEVDWEGPQCCRTRGQGYCLRCVDSFVRNLHNRSSESPRWRNW